MCIYCGIAAYPLNFVMNLHSANVFLLTIFVKSAYIFEVVFLLYMRAGGISFNLTFRDCLYNILFWLPGSKAKQPANWAQTKRIFN